MSSKFRWAVLAPGRISRAFATGLQSVADAELVACGSRSLDRAKTFADEFDVPRSYGSYDELAADDDIDAVYVASPHICHAEHSIMMLKSGKAVLCEKPFAINAGQVSQMIAAANENGAFLMEAMWTRFLPHIRKTVELVESGAIGAVRMLNADFGFRGPWNPQGRLLDPALGGGALMDVGVYCVSLAQMLLGEPVQIKSAAHLGETGVDEQAAAVMVHSGGAISVLSTAIRVNTPHEVVIMGEEGTLKINSAWWKPSTLQLTASGKTETIEVPSEGNGYNYQVQEVQRCLAAGKTQSDIMPLDQSLAVMQTLDTIRQQWGLKYPCE